MRSWFTAMPGEIKSCVGCHEGAATAAAKLVVAWRREVVLLLAGLPRQRYATPAVCVLLPPAAARALTNRISSAADDRQAGGLYVAHPWFWCGYPVPGYCGCRAGVLAARWLLLQQQKCPCLAAVAARAATTGPQPPTPLPRWQQAAQRAPPVVVLALLHAGRCARLRACAATPRFLSLRSAQHRPRLSSCFYNPQRNGSGGCIAVNHCSAACAVTTDH